MIVLVGQHFQYLMREVSFVVVECQNLYSQLGQMLEGGCQVVNAERRYLLSCLDYLKGQTYQRGQEGWRIYCFVFGIHGRYYSQSCFLHRMHLPCPIHLQNYFHIDLEECKKHRIKNFQPRFDSFVHNQQKSSYFLKQKKDMLQLSRVYKQFVTVFFYHVYFLMCQNSSGRLGTIYYELNDLDIILFTCLSQWQRKLELWLQLSRMLRRSLEAKREPLPWRLLLLLLMLASRTKRKPPRPELWLRPSRLLPLPKAKKLSKKRPRKQPRKLLRRLLKRLPPRRLTSGHPERNENDLVQVIKPYISIT